MWFWKLILRLGGWRLDNSFKDYNRACVMLGVPHTSNWDAIYALAVFNVLGIPVKFTIKKEWLRFPFKRIMLKLGAIPIDRNLKRGDENKSSMTKSMIKLFEDQPFLVVLITPEGTRSLRQEWKTGFYFVAKGAGVPIGLGYLDYKKRVAGVGKFIFPGDDMEKDMKEIMSFYNDVNAKYPEGFSVDQRYFP